MSATPSMQGDHPKGKVRHSWRCDHRAPVLETIRRDATGRGWVCWQCQRCGGTDLDSRMIDRLLPDDGPEAA